MTDHNCAEVNLFVGTARVLGGDMQPVRIWDLAKGTKLLGGGVVAALVCVQGYEPNSIPVYGMRTMCGPARGVCTAHAVQRLHTRVSLADVGRNAWMFAREAPNMAVVGVAEGHALYGVLLELDKTASNYAAPTLVVCNEDKSEVWHFASLCQPHFGLACTSYTHTSALRAHIMDACQDDDGLVVVEATTPYFNIANHWF